MDYPLCMAELTIQYPDDLLAASGKPRQAVANELKFQLAVRLFEIGELSLGKAAALASMARLKFADELGRLKIPVINLAAKEIQAEIRVSRGDYHRG